MFRKATLNDLDRITEIYNEIHTEEEEGRTAIGWVRSIYPTRETACSAINAEDMFVLEKNGKIVACARINQEQVAEYVNAPWNYQALAEQVMVLHTLVVSPKESGKGYGPEFVNFYETYALEHNCPYLRMDTNKINVRARALYQKLGYTEVGIVKSFFNGIAGVQLVCLEKVLDV